MAARSRLTADIPVGSRVTVTGKKGVVKFVGPTEFAGGEWIGVELDAAEGKNNGSVNGVVYFDGRDGHGLFVKKAQVRLDRSAPLPAASATAESKSTTPMVSSATPSVAGRTSSRLAAIREKNKALKESLAAGKSAPQASLRGSFSAGVRSPGGDSSQGDSNNPGSPASIASIGSVSSDNRKSLKTLRGSASGELNYRTSFSLGEHSRGDSKSGTSSFGTAALAEAASSPRRSVSSIPTSARARRSLRGADDRVAEFEAQLAKKGVSSPVYTTLMPPPSSPGARSESAEVLRAQNADATSEVEKANIQAVEASARLDASEACCRDLEAKLSLLQKKSENALGEERLKASLLAKEKAATAAADRRVADIESQVAELTDACEALTLDKEQLALEKEDLQEKVDELQVELDSVQLDLEHAQLSSKENEAAARALRAAGGTAEGDGGLDVKTLAEENVQLREALKRLHVHSVGEKTELTKAVRTLEKEAVLHATLKGDVEKLQAWKSAKAVEIEDLMEQLDESKAYEEMVETLTAKNLELGERCGELEATISDLESSVELSEELEGQQGEDMRELQADLTDRDVRLHNQQIEIDSMKKELEDTKQTIDRFREYAEQLKASRDDLAAAAAANAGNTALTDEERRIFLKQKAFTQRQATETRRAKMSGRMLELALLDARARASRISMLLPDSLLLAETELRCAEVDLSMCRLVGKAILALELLEVPAIEFIDTLAGVKADDGATDENADSHATQPLDRMTAIEDCTRFVREAEESLVLAQVAGETLTALNVTTGSIHTLSKESQHGSIGGLASGKAAVIGAEIASAVTEAEGLVDGLIRVIQDEGGLPPQLTASTIAALVTTTEGIKTRRVASIESGVRGDGTTDSSHTQIEIAGSQVDESIGAAVAVLHDCLVWAKRATLAAAEAALRDTEGAFMYKPPGSTGNEERLTPWQTLRGLWGDLIILRRSATDSGSGRWCHRLHQLALGAKDVLGNVHAHFLAKNRRFSAVREFRDQVLSLRIEAKELARSGPASTSSRVGTLVSFEPVPPCPRDLWTVVAPSLPHNAVPSASGGKNGNAKNTRLMAPCAERAECVRMSLEQAMGLKPDLEASRARVDELARELGSRSKELIAATSKREQLEALLERANGAQAASLDLQRQVLLLQEKSTKVEQENKFMAEALDDLQDSTSRLEAENRTLKIGVPPAQRGVASTGSRAKGQSARVRGGQAEGSHSNTETPAAADLVAQSALAIGTTSPAAEELEASLATALQWSQAEVARWRGKVFSSVLAGLQPLPHICAEEGGLPRFSKVREHKKPGASDLLKELVVLSRRLEAVRDPPRVVRVRGAKHAAVWDNDKSSVEPITSTAVNLSLAGVEWYEQKMRHARLEKEWRNGQGRAERALILDAIAREDTYAFGESAAANLPGPHAFHRDSDTHVARLRLPPIARFQSVRPRSNFHLLLEQSSLSRLQQALVV